MKYLISDYAILYMSISRANRMDTRFYARRALGQQIDVRAFFNLYRTYFRRWRFGTLCKRGQKLPSTSRIFIARSLM